MKIQDIPAIKSTFSSASLGGAILCLTCVFAVLSANELRLHASQWSPQDPAHNVAAGAGDPGTHMDLEATRKLLSSGNPPALGLRKAPVTIVEFADFECGHCKRMSDLLEKQFLPEESNKVRFVYRYLPLPQHPWAKPVAQMAACVELQDHESFWKLHDYLYANQESFSVTSVRPQVEDFLTKHGKLNTKAFESCVDSNATAGQVESDMQMARDLNVHETPVLFVNGTRLQGIHELQQLEDAVAAALKDQTAAKLDQ
jgi:protein-disulfide isomerase